MTPDRNGAEGSWAAGFVRLHWWMAVLILLVLASGYIAEHGVEGETQARVYEVHFSLGLIALLLVVLRAGWRLAVRAPVHPAISPIHRWAARIVHFLLYAAMFAVILSGWTNFMFLGPVRVFGLVDVPRLFDPETQEPLRALSWYVHYYSYWALLLLVILHAAAALYHHFVARDRVLLDFLPRR